MQDRLRNFGFLLKEVSRRYVNRFEVRAAEIPLNLAHRGQAFNGSFQGLHAQRV